MMRMMRRPIAVGLGLLAVLAVSSLPAQEVEWTRTWGGTGYDAPFGIALGERDHVHVAGQFQGTVDLDPGPGVLEYTAAGDFAGFVSKLDDAGNLVWAVPFTGSGDARAYDLVVDREGDVYVMGQFSGVIDFDPDAPVVTLVAIGVRDAFLAKLSAEGQLVWAVQFGSWNAGDPREVRGWDLQVDTVGNVYAVGAFGGAVDFDPGLGEHYLVSDPELPPLDGPTFLVDAFLLKLNPAGEFAWVAQWTGDEVEQASDVAIDDDGNIHVIGQFDGTVEFDSGLGTVRLTSNGMRDAFVTKLDSSGGLEWAVRAGGVGDERCDGVVVDEVGNAYVVGPFSDTVDFDPGPGVLDLTSAGQLDLYVWKLDPDGELVWAVGTGGESLDLPLDVALDDDGDIYAVGYFRGLIDLDPGPEVRDFLSAGILDGFVLQLDREGALIWGGRIGGESYDSLQGVVLGDQGKIYLAGDFRSTADLDPGSGVYERTSAGVNDAFVLELADCDYFAGSGGYGRLLVPPLCTRSSPNLQQPLHGSATMSIHRGASDTFYVSSDGMSFAPLIVDDELRVDSVDSGLGPYALQPGVTEAALNVPIEENLVPQPAHEITDLIGVGANDVLFEMIDTAGTIYGNTAVYLLRDCGIVLERDEASTTLRWISAAVEIDGMRSDLDVVSGSLGELRGTRDFSGSCLLASVTGDDQAIDPRPDPPAGDGYYYLVRGTCASPIGFGDSGMTPDPRDALDAALPTACQ